MTDKIKRLMLVSPKGTFVYPKLNEPDYGTKEYPKADGEYSVRLRMRADAPETKAFIAKLQPLYDAAMANADVEFKKLDVASRKKHGKVKPNDLFATVYDKETEEATGDIDFKFSTQAGGTIKKGPKTGKTWERRPTIFDAKGTPMKNAPAIWGGTVGKVSFSTTESGYFVKGTAAAGLKLSLEAVQIIDLVQGGDKSAKEHGFGEEEGYSAPTEETFPTDQEGAVADAKTDNEDF